MKKKVTWGEAWVILRPGTITDSIVAQIIQADVARSYGPDVPGVFRQFGRICSLAESSSGFPFKPELMRNSDSIVRRSGYEAFISLPDALFEKFIVAYNALVSDKEVGIEDIPDEELSKKA